MLEIHCPVRRKAGKPPPSATCSSTRQGSYGALAVNEAAALQEAGATIILSGELPDLPIQAEMKLTADQ